MHETYSRLISRVYVRRTINVLSISLTISTKKSSINILKLFTFMPIRVDFSISVHTSKSSVKELYCS